MHARPTDQDAPPRWGGRRAVFVSAPPFGPAIWAGVCGRLGGGRTWSPGAEGVGTWGEAADRLASQFGDGRTVLVGHGLGVPAVLGAACRAAFGGVVVIDGPVTRVDPLTRLFARVGALPGAAGLLRPGLVLPLLRSSLGLRRAVRNPYVMDREQVAALCTPAFAEERDRRVAVAWAASVVEGLPELGEIPCPVLALWGREDRLYPTDEAAFVESVCPMGESVQVGGARLGGPVELPWAFADGLEDWARRLQT